MVWWKDISVPPPIPAIIRSSGLIVNYVLPRSLERKGRIFRIVFGLVDLEPDIGDENEVRPHQFGVASYTWDLEPVLLRAAESSITLFVRGIFLPFGRMLHGWETWSKVVVGWGVVRAGVVRGFCGLFLSARACILVSWEVLDARFLSNVFAALESGIRPWRGGLPCLYGYWADSREVGYSEHLSWANSNAAHPPKQRVSRIRAPSTQPLTTQLSTYTLNY